MGTEQIPQQEDYKKELERETIRITGIKDWTLNTEIKRTS